MKIIRISGETRERYGISGGRVCGKAMGSTATTEHVNLSDLNPHSVMEQMLTLTRTADGLPPARPIAEITVDLEHEKYTKVVDLALLIALRLAKVKFTIKLKEKLTDSQINTLTNNAPNATVTDACITCCSPDEMKGRKTLEKKTFLNSIYKLQEE